MYIDVNFLNHNTQHYKSLISGWLWYVYSDNIETRLSIPPSLALFCHQITSHHITSHHITSHHITSHHITSHHITSHHITSHHITSHHSQRQRLRVLITRQTHSLVSGVLHLWWCDIFWRCNIKMKMGLEPMIRPLFHRGQTRDFDNLTVGWKYVLI